MGTTIVISTDVHDDPDSRNLLGALENSLPNDVEFEDLTPTEIRSSDIAGIKRALESRISEADYLLALVGDHANDLHDDRAEIGEPNWQWWEIKKAKELGKKLVGVKLREDCACPGPLLTSNARWALSSSVAAVVEAVRAA